MNSKDNRLPKLIVMIGLPASGKSTEARYLAKENGNCAVVSSDEIRKELGVSGGDRDAHKEVFKIFQSRVKAEIDAGNSVIADATHITIKSRRFYQNFSKNKCFKVAYVMAKPIMDCKIQNCVRDYNVPESAIDSMVRRFEIPFYEEGWDEIVIHDAGCQTNCISSVFSNYLDCMKDFKQDNPHHELILYEHCKRTEELIQEYAQTQIYVPWSLVRAAALHDIGKVFTQTYDSNGVAHYYGHANVGAYLLMCDFLNCPFHDQRSYLQTIFFVNYHMYPFSTNSFTNELAKEHAVNKMRQRFGIRNWTALTILNECDIKAAKAGDVK